MVNRNPSLNSSSVNDLHPVPNPVPGPVPPQSTISVTRLLPSPLSESQAPMPQIIQVHSPVLTGREVPPRREVPTPRNLFGLNLNSGSGQTAADTSQLQGNITNLLY